MKPVMSKGHMQAGMTLIEIMISLAIGVMVIAAGLQMFQGSKQNYRMIEASSRIQEDARYVMDMMAVDIRMAGVKICGDTEGQVNVIQGAGDDVFDLLNTPLRGFEAGAGATFPAGTTHTVGTDVLRVKLVDTKEHYFVASHNTGSSLLTLNQSPSLSLGEAVLVCDPEHTAVFQVSGVNSGANQISHAYSSPSPGNCTNNLGSPLPGTCGDGAGTTYSFSTIAQAYKAMTVQYYVALGSDGVNPSLYRARLEASSGGVLALAPQELIPGVENFQLQFGEDTDGDELINVYRNASAVSDWDAVLSARLSLVFRSQEANVVDSAQKYVLEGVELTAPDNRLRRVFTSTIGIRNRLTE